MTVGYKFMAHKWVRAFLGGSVAVGTASKFREPDGKGPGRSDPYEVTRSFQPGAVTIPSTDISFVVGHTGVSVSFDQSTTMAVQGDAHVFCVSKSVDRVLRQRMLEVFEDDCFVRISDMEQFSRLVTEYSGFNRDGHFAEVIYDDHIPVGQPKDWSSPSPFEKRTEYSWQRELRACWPGNDLVPQIVSVPQVAPLLHYIPSYRLK